MESELRLTTDITTVEQPITKEDHHDAIRIGRQDASFVKRNQRVLSVLCLQLSVALGLSIAVSLYGAAHNVPTALGLIEFTNIKEYTAAVAAFDFVGVSSERPEPSSYAVFLEIFFWSWFGVLARELFNLTQVIIHKKNFKLLEGIGILLGEVAMGITIAVAAVTVLRAAQLTIGNINLTLKTADVELIAAISFVLGFYHEDTRRLLGNFRNQVSDNSKEANASTVEQ